MKAIVICPDRPAALDWFAQRRPACLVPLFGSPILTHHLEALAELGVKEVLVLASDRPEQVRAAVGNGERWGMNVQVVPEPRELNEDEARARFGRPSAADVPKADWLVVVANGLPGESPVSALSSGRHFYDAAVHAIPQAHRRRVGVKEVRAGVWLGLGSRVDPSAVLVEPCWIGEGVQIGAGATVGPCAIIEDQAVVEAHAEVAESWVGPGTYVGAMTHVRFSLAWGNQLMNWSTGSHLAVTDAFLLGNLGKATLIPHSTWAGRLLAFAVLVATSPIALLAWCRRGTRMCEVRSAVRPAQSGDEGSASVITYRELSVFKGLIKRWPQLWNIVRGEFAWVGNRPLSQEQAQQLATEFEQMWLSSPVGLISLADAEGAGDAFNDETKTHSSFYAAQASPQLNRRILWQTLRRGWAALFGRNKSFDTHEHKHA